MKQINSQYGIDEAILDRMSDNPPKYREEDEPRYRYKLICSDFLGKHQDVCLKIYMPHTHTLVSALMLDLFRINADNTLIETAQRVVKDIEANDNLDKYDDYQDSLIP